MEEVEKHARNWECFDAIVSSLKSLENDETLLIQSGKPVGIFRSHIDAPRVLIANSNLVGKWANWEHFRELGTKRPYDVWSNDSGFLDLYWNTRYFTGNI